MRLLIPLLVIVGYIAGNPINRYNSTGGVYDIHSHSHSHANNEEFAFNQGHGGDNRHNSNFINIKGNNNQHAPGFFQEPESRNFVNNHNHENHASDFVKNSDSGNFNNNHNAENNAPDFVNHSESGNFHSDNQKNAQNPSGESRKFCCTAGSIFLGR